MTDDGHPGPNGRLRSVRGRIDALTWWVVGIAGAGLLFRIAYILVAKRDVDTCGRFLCGDAFYYSASAKFFAGGHGFNLSIDQGPFLPAADHPPLTTLLMAPVSFVQADGTHVAQRLLMALIGTGVVVALALLTRRLAGDRAALVAAVLGAANANLFMNDVLVMAETVAAACLVALLWLAYRFIDAPTMRRALALGLALGVAGLGRAELLLYGPVLIVPVALWARQLGWWARVGRVAVAATAALAVLVPWTLFNLTRFDEPVVLSTNDGLTLIGANCDATYGIPDRGGLGFWNLTCTDPIDATLPAEVDASVRAAAYRDAAFDYIGDHLDRVPEVIAYRLGRGWGVLGPDGMIWLNQGEGRDAWASRLGYWTWWALVPLAALGAINLRRRRVPIWPLLSSVVVVTLTLVLFYGIVRFRLPADLSATILAAVGVDWLLEWVSRRRAQPVAAT